MGMIIAVEAETSVVAARLRIFEMRKRARKDMNQDEIVSTFRYLGFTVAITSALGGGFPDIVIAKYGRNWLVEIKNGDLPPSERQLTEDEKAFHDKWEGEIFIINSMDEAVALAVKLSKEFGG